MKKSTSIIVLTLTVIGLFVSIAATRGWLERMDIPIGNSCAIMSALDFSDEKRVCTSGTCMRYSDWIKTPEGKKALAEK